jgi:FMN phosphatase YigB (HAD superfamily)
LILIKLFFVDDQLSEVETAASLGMITFWFQNNNHHGDNAFDPHIVINSLADSPKHLIIK